VDLEEGVPLDGVAETSLEAELSGLELVMQGKATEVAVVVQAQMAQQVE
jgi:hypothetical protein